MKLEWKISPRDVEKVRAIVERQASSPLVQYRLSVNLAKKKSLVSRDSFWRALVGALLTSQQRSGPESSVSRFINTRPHPIGYAACRRQPKLSPFLQTTLADFGGIRFSTKLASVLSSNYSHLENGAWQEVLSRLNALTTPAAQEAEREVAEYLDDEFKGLGPKQSRNLLQGLGLTRYEIPVDSRITKWLNKFGFPFHLTAAALVDRHYYGLVSDGIQHLCQAAGVMPCVFDAAVPNAKGTLPGTAGCDLVHRLSPAVCGLTSGGVPRPEGLPKAPCTAPAPSPRPSGGIQSP